MYWVSSKKDNLYGVTDTSDNVETYFTARELIEIAVEDSVEIDGVSVDEGKVCIVRLKNDTIRLFKQGKVHLAISTMSLQTDTIGLRFERRVNRCGSTFILKEVLNIARSGVNSYSFDKGNSKSYRGGLTLDDIMTVVEGYLSNWKLVGVSGNRL